MLISDCEIEKGERANGQKIKCDKERGKSETLKSRIPDLEPLSPRLRPPAMFD
jgi:hypothetical protein